jgi:hypothetical protein
LVIFLILVNIWGRLRAESYWRRRADNELRLREIDQRTEEWNPFYWLTNHIAEPMAKIDDK